MLPFRRRALRRPAAFLIAAAAILAVASPAHAHPHVWVATRAEIVFDPERRLLGFWHSWTFDEAYSAFSVNGLDSHRDGKPDPDKLAELAKTNMESLEEWNYFTAAKVNGKVAEFGPPRDYSQSFADGRLTLRFFLPLKTPTTARVLALTVDDPTFFVAFNLKDGDDAVRMVEGKGCALNVKRPPKAADEGVQLLADDVAGALAGKAGAGSVGEDYVARILVACP